MSSTRQGASAGRRRRTDLTALRWAELGGPLAVGVALALALGCAALPLVARVTAGDATRFE